MRIKIEDLQHACDFVSWDSDLHMNRAVLDRKTGKIYFDSEVTGDNDIPPGLEDEGDRCVEVPSKQDLELGRPVVFRFVAAFAPELESRVESFFRRAGAYGKFKDLLEDEELLDEWYGFEEEQTRAALGAWCEQEGLSLEDTQAEKWVPATPRTVDVFFYGLFMDVEVLRQAGVEPGELRRAQVPDFAVRIGQRATLIPSPGARAYGLLTKLSHDDLDRLYGDPSVEDYRPEAVLVRCLDEEGSVPALCYNLGDSVDLGTQDLSYTKSLRDVLAALGLPDLPNGPEV